MESNQIDSKNCIVAFLDILGYRKLIEEKSLAEISQAFHVSFDTFERFKKDPPDQDIKNVLDCIRTVILSDSLIFTLDLDKLPVINTGYRDVSNQFICVFAFLHQLSLFAITFMSELGYFLRGGISKGQYRQEQVVGPTHQVIISKALVEAYDLENIAGVPRILISDELCAFLGGENRTKFPPPWRRGWDGLYYLDLYRSLFLNSSLFVCTRFSGVFC